jgi:hypothetical protein
MSADLTKCEVFHSVRHHDSHMTLRLCASTAGNPRASRAMCPPPANGHFWMNAWRQDENVMMTHHGHHTGIKSYFTNNCESHQPLYLEFPCTIHILGVECGFDVERHPRPYSGRRNEYPTRWRGTMSKYLCFWLMQ